MTGHDLGAIRAAVEARAIQEAAEYGTGEDEHGKGNPRGLRLIPLDELLAEPKPTDWLIRDYMDRASLACLFGASGTMKSFVALDMGLSIASGLPWHGCRVKQGPVIYVAGEGFGGLAKRIQVWTRQHNAPHTIPFHVSERAVAVLDPESLAEAEEAIDALAGQIGNPAMVVIDTLARNFGPGDENSTKDMSAFVAGLDAIKSRYGCAVLAVHHTGLTATERGRGSYALHAGLDYEFRLEAQGDIRVLSATKVKDHEPPVDVAFLPAITSTGWTDPETGADITSVVLNRTGLPGKKERGLSGAKRIALEALRACLDENGQAHIKEWRGEAYRQGISTSEDQESRRRAFKRAVGELLDLGLVETRDDLFWITGQPDKNRTCPDLSGGTKPGQTGHTPLGVSGCPVSGQLSFAGEEKEGGAA